MNQKPPRIYPPVALALAKVSEMQAKTAETAVEKGYRLQIARKLRALARQQD